jgi:predicted  nucleic acid-binding Zn-ribbon protein
LIKQYKAIIQELRQELEDAQQGINTDDLVQKSLREKEEFEFKIKELEEIIFQHSNNLTTATTSASTTSASDDANNEKNTFYLNKINQLTQELTKAQKYSTTLLDSLNESKKQIKSQKSEIYGLETKLSELQQRVSEIQNLEELRQNFEEYSQNITQQIDQDRLKIERETNYLTSERSKHLTEKTQLDEKVRL